MVEWASGPPPKQPANPLWSGRVREGGALNLGVTGQGGRPDNESTPDTRQHPPPPIKHSNIPPREEPAMLAMGEQETPRPDTGPPSQPGLEQEHSIRPLLLSVFIWRYEYLLCPEQDYLPNQVSPAIGGEFHMHTHGRKNSSLKRFNYVSEL